jgi:hypothetical protein
MSNAQEDDATRANAALRRMRLAQIEADNEHGRQLIERYGHEGPRPRYAEVKYPNMKRRRR